MTARKDDRAAYLAGEESELGAEERAELDDVRGVLGSAAAWAEPNADLEDRVVAAIAQEPSARGAGTREQRQPLRLRARWHWSRPAYAFGGFAAAAAVAAIAIFLATDNGAGRPPQQFAMVVS